MGGSKMNAGFGNAPNGKWQGEPAGNNLVSNTISILNGDKPPGCTNPTNTTNTTAFLDSAASYSLMGRGAHVNISETQETNKILGTPNKAAIMTTETLKLLLKKLPKAARKAFRVQEIPHKLIAECKLVDAGCGVSGTLNAFLAASGSFFKSNSRVSIVTIAALFGVPRVSFVSWVSDILICAPRPISEYEAAESRKL